jgi:hypothetical protein
VEEGGAASPTLDVVGVSPGRGVAATTVVEGVEPRWRGASQSQGREDARSGVEAEGEGRPLWWRIGPKGCCGDFREKPNASHMCARIKLHTYDGQISVIS